jgi:tetratricopeptide (TPR) repeat protein
VAADRCVALAELLREEAQVYDELGNDDEAIPRYLKALRLYLEALADEESLRAADIPGLDDVVQRVSWHPVPAGTRQLLLPYLEATGQFDQLENVVTAWMDHDDRGEARAFAVAMYERLAEVPDSELIVGGLTRGEVMEALAAFTEESPKTPTV